MSEIKAKQRATTFLAHLLCISILFILPEVLTSLSSPDKPLRLWVYSKGVVYIIVFYLEYYLVLGHSLNRQLRLLRYVGWNIVLLALALCAVYLIWRFREHLGGKPHKMPPHPTEGIYIAKWVTAMTRDLVMIVLVIGFATALRFGDRILMMDRTQREMVNAQREEELSSLKSQLNPHFLFNTLNSIYALIAVSPERAQEAVHELSRLLRFMLYDSSATVTLRRELDFIANYISLMKLRLNPSLKLEVTLDAGDCAERQVAPLLFIAIIENVFKHGIHTPDVALRISIRAEDGRVTCETSNGIARTDDAAPGGIGLANLRRRLQLIYGDSASLTTTDVGGVYTVRMQFPLTLRQ